MYRIYVYNIRDRDRFVLVVKFVMNLPSFICYIVCPDDFFCLNGGTCVNGSCSCPFGFKGIECDKGNGLYGYD